MTADDPTAVLEDDPGDGPTFGTGVAFFAAVLTLVVYLGWLLTGEIAPGFAWITAGVWLIAVGMRGIEMRGADR